MRTLHVVYSFRPDPIGGTEVYVESLCRELQALGDDAVVAAPGRSGISNLEGLRVRRFDFQNAPALAILYGRPDPVAVASFARILDEESPDVVHQHAISPACSAELMDEARRRRIPVVFTYHTPAVSCQRGTLMRWGHEPCDGRLATSPCAACALAGRVPRMAAAALALVPPAVGDAIGRRGWSGGAWTALRSTSLLADRRRSVTRLFSAADRYVALTPWVRRLLIANGVPAERIVDVRHGVDLERRTGADLARREPPRAGLRIAHLGRLDPTKGTDVLVRAVRSSSMPGVTLDVFGIAQSDSGRAYRQRLVALAEGDSRIQFLEPVRRGDLLRTLARYDVVAVPSRWFETGPLVVLEAFAAGVPVIGSDLPGVADQVTAGVNGVLVSPHNSVPNWRRAIEELAGNAAALERLRAGVSPPRTGRDVALAMRDLYRELAPAANQPRRAVSV